MHKKDTKIKSNNVTGYNSMKEDHRMTSSNNTPNSMSGKLRDNDPNNIGNLIK
ncbi:MAG: hypothetical protein L0H53_15020 [Candidatus Nitrosocosmicus sp.]|nr:hypothetical protein [Candidatus Nitrosocosmicus sp.]MDN5868719.1 hypothetical protein [Candidatus Nitrosocosmicus sp.]